MTTMQFGVNHGSSKVHIAKFEDLGDRTLQTAACGAGVNGWKGRSSQSVFLITTATEPTCAKCAKRIN